MSDFAFIMSETVLKLIVLYLNPDNTKM
jgi:hypothetical protein